MGPEFPESLRKHLEEYEQSVHQFRSGLAQANSEIAKVREEQLELSDIQKHELENLYRAGLHGPELQEIQLRVDSGEFSWEDIKSGRAGEEVSNVYYQQTLGPDRTQGVTSLFSEALRAAFNGVSFEDFARERGLIEPVQDNETKDYWDRGTQPRWGRYEDED